MEQFVAVVKKYGVTGVLAMWLWHTDTRLNKVETALYDCYKTQSIVKKHVNSAQTLLPTSFAIIPQKSKTRIKNGYITI